MKVNKNKELKYAVQVAFTGMFNAFMNERNMKIHALAAIVTIALALFMKVGAIKLSILLVCIAMVISLEIMNSAIEFTVDLVTQDYKPLAKKAKDTAAGAVLFASLVAVFIAILIFWQEFSIVMKQCLS